MARPTFAELFKMQCDENNYPGEENMRFWDEEYFGRKALMALCQIPDGQSVQQEIEDLMPRAMGQLRMMTGANSWTLGTQDKEKRAQISWKFKGGGGKAKDSINYVRLSYQWNDLFRLELIRIRGTKVTTVHDFEDVYVEDLKGLFEDNTGFVLGVPRIVGLNA